MKRKKKYIIDYTQYKNAIYITANTKMILKDFENIESFCKAYDISSEANFYEMIGLRKIKLHKINDKLKDMYGKEYINIRPIDILNRYDIALITKELNKEKNQKQKEKIESIMRARAKRDSGKIEVFHNNDLVKIIQT